MLFEYYRELFTLTNYPAELRKGAFEDPADAFDEYGPGNGPGEDDRHRRDEGQHASLSGPGWSVAVEHRSEGRGRSRCGRRDHLLHSLSRFGLNLV